MTISPKECVIVTIEQLRTVHQAAPYRPFTLYLADGRSYHVPHGEFLSQSPSGRTIVVHHADDTFSVIDLLLVAEIKVDASPASAEQR